ncbi:mitochondrial 39-S ribosomal protein L47 (MRP-L47)-domain-containing protein [Truncatella angustata]|uniref:Large ribosomal subunit protein uL29m n=1 Tax=Truncatella angustata TaxID=152316 RepID=A0A9P8UXI6_9PEZI|nr:mitochondrial 39-S ribosomal protein L47 (MRP-L47)-domain-containing protein [Truncatella angustata]KAH6659759.1 mitochondrial 39-S ribosomal protein L47 (MRP-L47)-domain-containing protein [Truncatella angustata]
MATSITLRPVVGRIIQRTSQRSPSACLALATGSSPSSASAPFSTTAYLEMRKPRRDNNRLRGLSAIKRSGTKARMTVDGIELPEPAKYNPVDDFKTDPEHGLYDFFYDKEKALLTPEDEAQHGRSWNVEELRHKSWDDLHTLWWACTKERNRIATASRERTRLKLKTGGDESQARMQTVSRTMKSIKQALTERFYAWEDARQLAEEDPEVDLANAANPYTPRNYFEEEVTGSEALGAVQETADLSALPKAPEGEPVART